uniref:integrin beta-5-like isoform X2 n=1 Tax=Myxine glutinosa TaxID=7769 RepID=UPI0035902129
MTACRILMIGACLFAITVSPIIGSRPSSNPCIADQVSSCQECVLLHPSCAWCAHKTFSKYRCNLPEQLLQQGCPPNDVAAPQSVVSLLQAVPHNHWQHGWSPRGNGIDNLTQLSPQHIALTLRPGQKVRFPISVRQAEDYPVDLYYLMDLSLSMHNDLHTIRDLGPVLADQMAKLTSNFRLGFGSFVDKLVSPFINVGERYQENPCTEGRVFRNCPPTFAYNHILSLTADTEHFRQELLKQKVSANKDSPEGGFDAMLQAAVCVEQLGWRKEATHLLLMATDASSHLPLDGRIAGLLQPHDGQCHLDSENQYSATDRLDYPSLGLLGEKFSENNINLIFAITVEVADMYKVYSELIPGATVGILADDSSNIINLIVEAYSKIRSKVELEAFEQPEDISLMFTALCGDGQRQAGQRFCHNVKLGETVSFEVEVEAKGCAEHGRNRSFMIKPLGMTEALHISIRVDCGCLCLAEAQDNSSECNNAGTLECGVCRCNPSHIGPTCECPQKSALFGGRDACREAEGSPVCSGRGHCICGTCVCHTSEYGNFNGQFCECDDFSCDNFQGKICSGHGSCQCGICKCDANWTGEICNCSQNETACLTADGTVCSKRGECVCGRCICDEGSHGNTCEKCPSCSDICSAQRDCVECKLFNTGPLASGQKCEMRCSETITVVENIDSSIEQLCTYKDDDGCVMHFALFESPGGYMNITALQNKECTQGQKVLPVVLAVASTVLGLGLLALLIWKLLVSLHDRREVARFIQEQGKACWEAETNPIYKGTVSTFTNVAYASSNSKQ